MIWPLIIAAAGAIGPPADLQALMDPQNGVWKTLRHGPHVLSSAPAEDVRLQWEGGALPPVAQWRLVDISVAGRTTTVVRRAADWEVRTDTTTAGLRMLRRASFRWLGSGDVMVTRVVLATPPLRLSSEPGEWALVPGNFPIDKQPIARMAEGHRILEGGWTRGDYGLGVVHAPGAHRSLVAAYSFEHDQAHVSMVKKGQGVAIEHAFDTLARLRPGDTVTVGTQVLQVIMGNETDLQAGMRSLSDSLGNGPPSDQPGHLQKLTLCEVHPWGRSESWHRGDTGNRYDRLTRLVPYYRDLGITGLWLLPVSWPPPWVYTLKDFGAIAPENGSPEQLRELVQTAHRHGLKMLIDLVVYGIHPEAEEVKRLPEDVWCRDRNGEPTRVWGGTVLAADTTHPVWQRRIAEVVGRWAREFGFDGTRLDCIGWGQAPNWSVQRPLDAIAYGGLQLNKVVRDAMRRANPDAVTLPEGGKPLVFRHADMVFDYPLYLAMRDLTWQPSLAQWVADIRQWLEWERCAYPQRALKGLVRFLECHDAVASTEYFGVGPSQALMAACVLMQGVPLIQQEQEIGFSADLAAWLKLRNRESCFYAGSADYLATSCSDGEVLTFLRRGTQSAAIVAINMTGRAKKCTLRWPTEISDRFPVALDAFTGKRLRLSTLTAPHVIASEAMSTRTPAGQSPNVIASEAKQSPSPSLARAGDRFVVPPRDDVHGYASASGANPHVIASGAMSMRTPAGQSPNVIASEAKQSPSPSLARAGDRFVVPPRDDVVRKGRRLAEVTVTIPPYRPAVILLRKAGASVAPLVKPRPDWTVVTSEGTLADRSFDQAVKLKQGERIEDALPTLGRAMRADELGLNDGAIPAGIAGGPVKVDTNPMFVMLANGRVQLTLARRHGGVIAGLDRLDAGKARPVILSGGDCYTDNGFFPNRLYASVDGETNPRLAFTRHGDAVTATFTGNLRQRSWNGVQTCAVPGPPVRYELAYTMDGTDRVVIRMALTPSADVTPEIAFYALRVPIAEFGGWQRADASGRPGEALGVRLGQTGRPQDPLIVLTGGGKLSVESGDGLRSAFVIESGGGMAHLFLTMLDGAASPMRAGETIRAQVTLRVVEP
jgi:hypothetical protein